jgi:hypothetical protein
MPIFPRRLRLGKAGSKIGLLGKGDIYAAPPAI